MTLREAVARWVCRKIFACEPDASHEDAEGNWRPAWTFYSNESDDLLRALADAGPDDAAVEAAARELARQSYFHIAPGSRAHFSADFYVERNWMDLMPSARAALAAAFKTMGR